MHLMIDTWNLYVRLCEVRDTWVDTNAEAWNIVGAKSDLCDEIIEFEGSG